ncbi:MAG: MBOAT family protein [Gemmatimonas sp.]|nr:MBOAT family protein [Gemmatimonas sp.]
MLFNSFSFLAFFGVVAAAYYALPHRFRWPLLLAASVYFYSTFSLSYLVLLGAVTVVTYGAGLALGSVVDRNRRKGILAVGIVVVISALLVFKYYDFFLDSFASLLVRVDASTLSIFPRFPRLDLVLFVGLSFYTFSCVSYLVDVYEERLAPVTHFGHFALYVSYFPKLLAGPIERARPFLDQIRQPVRFDSAGVVLGLQLLLWGLFKKVVVADNLAAFVDGAYAQPAFASPADLVLATYFFAFQLYCDFSGYSDMAIGASMVLGIRLMENFRRPYLSTSVAEFWAKRWHLSLASWFRDYMYIPMGGSRVSQFRHYGNVLAVFLVSGLWHGASWTFVIWGGLNGLYQVISALTRGLRERVTGFVRIPSAASTVVSVVVTFHLILVTWVFFRAASIADAFTVISRVAAAASTLPAMLAARLQAADVLFPIALIVILFAIEILDERTPLWERVGPRPVFVRWAVYYAILIALVVFGSWQLQNFVYMQF